MELRNSLNLARRQQNIPQLLHILRIHSFRNIAGIMNPELFTKCYIGTKKLINEFKNELNLAYRLIKETEQIQLPKKVKLVKKMYLWILIIKIEFFSEVRHSYGRTALCLSGGAILGLYHFGVIKALYEQDLLPRIVTGSSAGSLVAALICSKPYEELPNVNINKFNTNNISRF